MAATTGLAAVSKFKLHLFAYLTHCSYMCVTAWITQLKVISTGTPQNSISYFYWWVTLTQHSTNSYCSLVNIMFKLKLFQATQIMLDVIVQL